MLQGGLCYGFSTLSWELYTDAHGGKESLAWSFSSLAASSLTTR